MKSEQRAMLCLEPLEWVLVFTVWYLENVEENVDFYVEKWENLTLKTMEKYRTSL